MVESDEYIEEYFLQLETVVINGIIGNNSILPGATCPTSNCKWPVTPTLGICSECLDLTSQVREAAQYTTNNSTYYVNLPFGFSTIPNSLKQVSITLRKETDTEAVWRLDSAIADTNWTETFSTRATIAILSSLGISPNYYDNTRQDSLVFAYNCSLYLCLQGYSTTASFDNISQQQVPATAEQMHERWDDEGTSV